MAEKPKSGTIGWIDLTVDDAGGGRDFYKAGAGWDSAGVDMGDYSDFMMLPPGGGPGAGVCHAPGGNAGLPPAWLIYIVVDDLDKSIGEVEKGGGKVVSGPKNMGTARYCVIRDPAGAHAALYQA